MDKNKYYKENLSILSQIDQNGPARELIDYKAKVSITDFFQLKDDELLYIIPYLSDPNFKITEKLARRLLESASNFFISNGDSMIVFRKILPYLPSILEDTDTAKEFEWGILGNLRLPVILNDDTVPATIKRYFIEQSSKRRTILTIDNKDLVEKYLSKREIFNLIVKNGNTNSSAYVWDLFINSRDELDANTVYEFIEHSLAFSKVSHFSKLIAENLTDEEIFTAYVENRYVEDGADIIRVPEFLGIERLTNIVNLIKSKIDSSYISRNNLNMLYTFSDYFASRPELLTGELKFNAISIWPSLARYTNFTDDELIRLINESELNSVINSRLAISEKVFLAYLDQCDKLGYTAPADSVRLLKNMSAETLNKLLVRMGSGIIPYLKYDDYNDIPDDIFEIISLTAELNGFQK